MHINTAVGEIRCYYLNLPKGDLTEGGKFTGEVLEKLVATARADERAKVLSEVEKMKKTDKFPQSLTTYDGKTKYFDRLSDGDLHYNQAISDVLNQLKEGKC